MKRVFATDVLVCPHCDGTRKLIALITDGLVVRKILMHLGLECEPRFPAPARTSVARPGSSRGGLQNLPCAPPPL